MMARKLAGLFTILALVAYFGTWLAVRFVVGAGGGALESAMAVEQAWQTGVGVAVLFYLVGLFMATLAIGMMQEILAERRSRESERRFRARLTYEAILEGEGSETAPPPPAPSAP